MDLTLHIIISVIDLVNVCAIGLIFYFLGDFVFLVRVDLLEFCQAFGTENPSFFRKGYFVLILNLSGLIRLTSSPLFWSHKKIVYHCRYFKSTYDWISVVCFCLLI